MTCPSSGARRFLKQSEFESRTHECCDCKQTVRLLTVAQTTGSYVGTLSIHSVPQKAEAK